MRRLRFLILGTLVGGSLRFVVDRLEPPETASERRCR